MKRVLQIAVAALLAAAASGSPSALAANVSFAGDLAGDDSVQLFSFTLASDTVVTLRTWSYAGGTNAAGSSIAAGGFDPIVSLFSGLGPGAILIDASDDGAGVAVDPTTGDAFDSLLDSVALTAGSYTVALSQFANFANGPTLADGFLGGGNLGFDGRSSAWALDLLGVDAAGQLPLPATLALALLGLAGIAAGRGFPVGAGRLPCSRIAATPTTRRPRCWAR